MTDWLITGLLLVAVIALAVLIGWTRQAVASMRESAKETRDSVKETVEQALGKAEDKFKSASHEALYDQQQKARESLGQAIGDSLTPVRDELAKAREELKEYSQQARDSAVKSGSAHQEMMRSISELDKEAETLSKALRGDVKMMGDWGEIALEKILDLSGLEKGIAYESQETVETDDGKRRPDVLLKLPKDGDGREKVIAVDSKVSLSGYAQYVDAGDDEQGRKAGRDKLMAAVKKQAEETAKYKKIEGYETPGVAFMFMPIAPAWELVQRHQNGDFVEDVQRKHGVVILGPTSMMASLQIVAQLWRGYMQDKNVKQIADVGGKMLDAVERSVERFEKLSKAIESSQAAAKQLHDSLAGVQGVRKYAKDLRDLGVKGKKETDSS